VQVARVVRKRDERNHAAWPLQRRKALAFAALADGQ
jgi:hypothetical protein